MGNGIVGRERQASALKTPTSNRQLVKGLLMNEWQTIAWVVGVGGSIFFGMYAILQDFKKGAHKRIDRLENVTDEIVRDHITSRAFNRLEQNITTRLDGMQSQMGTTNSRIDDLVLALNNNGKT